jgi:hypothetical protein
VAALLAAAIGAGPAALARQAHGQQAHGQQAHGQQAHGQQAQGQQAQGQQAQASRQLSVTIESVSPQWATPGHLVTVTGVVRNGTATPLQGLSVQLRSSPSPLGNRYDLTLYANGAYPVDYPEGTAVPLAGILPAGGNAHWTATLQPASIGMTQFGVYPLAAQVLTSVGVPAATDRTFLPFWPGGPVSQRPPALSVAWVWPLIDQPYQAACPALLSNGLAGSLAAGGRLGGLLAAGASYSAAAHLTWAIDPALVQNARTMSTPYAVGGNPGCGGAAPMQPSAAARGWLSGLTQATSGQQAFLTPYADVDIAALSHDGLDADLAHAFASRSAGSRFLHLPPGSGTTAWPDNGLADAGVLGSLAVNGISTVLLDSTVMPPSGLLPSYTPSAQTTAASGTGSSLKVLLTDHAITQILGAGSTTAGPGAGSTTAGPGAAFATAQRFLAETAMIVAERPLARSVVVAPPQRWNPVPGLASALLRETVRAPWLKPASLADLATAKHPSGVVARQAPPAHQVTGNELSRSYLGQVQGIDAAIKLTASILTPAVPGYLQSAVAALESSAWRGSQQAGTRQDLVDEVLRFVTAQGRKVSIIDRGQITLSGSSGKVPISIANRLPQNVQVRLHVRVPADKRLTVGTSDTLVSIPAGKTVTIRLSVHSPTVGTTDVTLGLLTPDGRPLPGTLVQLTVRATRFGTLALVIMCVALAVFVLTSSARAIRRSRRDGSGGPGGGQHDNPASDPPGPAAETGSVVSGDDLAHDHPPEDPDEYADARGRARR